MANAWLREAQPDLAVERILDAAGRSFARLGVPAAGMVQIAEAAGCSRATLYRYFQSRHALHLAYIERSARAISRRIRGATQEIADPRERLVAGVLQALREVRSDPGTAAWFEPGVAGIAARMSRSSDVIGSLNRAVVSSFLGARVADAETRLRARWLERVIVSLLTSPGESEREERALVERFVAPALAPPAAAAASARDPRR